MSEIGVDSGVRVILTTAPSGEVAERLARDLVSERLVACVNVVPGVLSVYRWQGAVRRDDEVMLVPTPGHTPGHCSVQLRSNDQTAMITGDMMVHPVQIAEPQWSQRADTDKELAIATRTRFINQHCDTDTLILGTHFNTPTGVYIVSAGEQQRIKW